MATVFLKMGKSTVLRFAEKPTRVVIGNQNYYGLEFIENDVAIQPLGSVGTNLFVYTQHHTYGFLLTPGDRYDDLVFVRWKYVQAKRKDTASPPTGKSSKPMSTFLVGKWIKVTVTKIQGPSTFGLHIIDLKVENSGKSELDISALELKAKREGIELGNQSTAIEKISLKPGEETKARIVLKVESKSDFSIEGKTKSFSGKTILKRKFL